MFVHHTLLALAVVALGAAAVRVASLAAPAGLERVTAAAPLMVAVAVIEALGLGLVGLGADPWALTIAALVTWVTALAALPAPVLPLGRELIETWRTVTPRERLALGMLAGVVGAIAATMAHRAFLGIDGVLYHLTEVVAWVHNGHPGSLVPVLHGFPVENYPLTSEVAVGWAMSISRSFVPVALWQTFLYVLLPVAGWVGLRSMRVSVSTRWLAVSALALSPLAVAELAGPNTDLPATTWLVVCASLCAASLRRPALLAPAVVAAGLSVGTKATTLPLVGIVLLTALWVHRGRLSSLALPLGLAVLAAIGAGGPWYIRNFIEHGSPLWPFVSTPWGDSTPASFDKLQHSLLERPSATLDGRVHLYVEAVGGGCILLVGALVAPLVRRARSVIAAAGVTGVALLLWAQAPITGIADDRRIAFYSLTTTRYLLPVVAVAMLTVALIARDRGDGTSARRRRLVANVILAAALLMDVALLRHVNPYVRPSMWVVLGAGAAGGLLAVALGRLHVPALPTLPLRLGAAALVLVAATVLRVPASGFAERHGNAPIFDAGIVRLFTGHPGLSRGRTIAMGPVVVSALSGDELRTPVELLPASESCASVRLRLSVGQIIVLKDPRLEELLTGERYQIARCLEQVTPAYRRGGWSVYTEGF